MDEPVERIHHEKRAHYVATCEAVRTGPVQYHQKRLALRVNYYPVKQKKSRFGKWNEAATWTSLYSWAVLFFFRKVETETGRVRNKLWVSVKYVLKGWGAGIIYSAPSFIILDGWAFNSMFRAKISFLTFMALLFFLGRLG